MFVRSGTIWSQEAYLKASNTEQHDHFGQSVAVSGDTVVVGAPGEDSNANGVNGDQSNNSADGAGAAYVFVQPTCFPNQTLPAELVSDPLLADTGGDPGLGPKINDATEVFDLSLDCSGMATGGVTTMVLRASHLAAPLSTGFGNLWLSGPVWSKRPGVHTQNVVSWGAVVLPNDPSLAGIEFTVQGFCSQSGGGSRLSSGLVQTVGP